VSCEIKNSFPRATSPSPRRDLPCSAQAYWLSLSFELKEAFMGHRSIANTVISTAVADKRVRNIWGK